MSKGSWTDPFGCCNKQASAVELLIDEATKDEESQNTELIQAERSLELQLIQAEQRLSALNLLRNKTNQKIKATEDKLSISSRRQAEAKNAKVIAEKNDEISSLKSKIPRLEKNLARLLKYNSSLSSELENFQKQTSASQSQVNSLKQQIQDISAEITDIKNKIQQSNDKFRAVEQTSNSKQKEIDALQQSVAEKKKEIEFANSMKNKLQSQNAMPTVPSRRGRPRPRPISVNPPQETSPVSNSPPKVPKRSSALADRMKMFE